MNLYKVKKENKEFFIQPEMIEDYSALGYTIIKMGEEVVEDVEAEVEKNRLEEG